LYSIEAEDLINEARASNGQFNRQDMSNFGRGWGGNAQLLWRPQPAIDRSIRNSNLTLSFNSPAGLYELVLHYTSAPDFAMYRVFVGGQQAADIDAYSSGVSPQSRSLGQYTLSSRQQLTFTVFGKARASRGFSVGIDRIELRPVQVAKPTENPNPDKGGSPGEQPGFRNIFNAQLNFARVSPVTQKWTEKGGTEQPLESSNLTAHFVWKSIAQNQFVWYWQVAGRNFSGPVTLSPDGLLAQKQISSPTFPIDFGSFPPLNAVTVNNRSRQPATDLYIRLVAVKDGKPFGVASNVVVAQYQPGKDSSGGTSGGAFDEAARRKREAEELAKAYHVQVLSFKPAIFADPDRWGCIYIIKNTDPYLAGAYPRGEHCGEPYRGPGYQANSAWDYITGWAKAYELASNFYEDAKKFVAHRFAESLPCEALGKTASACEKYANELAGMAINAGLAAVGVPPSLPSLSEIAKGQAVNAAVDLTCTTVENQGGQCSPKLRDALKKAYSAGLDKLAYDLDHVTKEPGCGNEKEAHENGREPLPCFGNNPRIEFRPADGAVYQPPMVTVRVTQNNSPVPEFSDLQLQLSVWLKNRFPGGTIESYYPPVPPTDLAAELFAPRSITLTSLAPGQSLNLVLPMGGIKQYTFSIPQERYAVHNGWCALYNGGTATASASTTCRNSFGERVSCGVGGERTIQMPKDANCSQ
jgi:hypothetical protein